MRQTHPNLFETYRTLAVISIASGLNLFFLTPAFMPLSLDKWIVGIFFLSCGIGQAAFLWINPKDHIWLMVSMAFTVGVYTFWAGALTYDFFDRSLTSLQLPIFVIGLARLALIFLTEPFTNPATEKNGQ